MNISPIGTKILIELREINEMRNGLYVPTKRQTRDSIAKVLEIGSKVKDCKVGDTVYFENGKFKIVDGLKAILDEKDIIMVAEE